MWFPDSEPQEHLQGMTTIAQQVQELERLSPAELAHRYQTLLGKPPRVRNAAWLRRQVAWHLQAQQLGGLTDRAKSRLDELIAGIDLPLAAPHRPNPAPKRVDHPKAPMVGTVLKRRWHDQEIIVEVREDGFAWDGVVYRSLSACAKAITGAAWNGKLFFGLTQRRARA
jgi:hypothetical protein